MTTEEQLAWEARQRPRAGLAAIASSLLLVAASVWSAIAFRDAPQSGLLDALQRAAGPEPVGTSPSLRLPYYEFFDDNAPAVLTTAALRGLSFVALGAALAVLAAATRHRRPELPRFAPGLAVAGALLSGLATVLTAVATLTAVGDFLDGPRTVDSADDLGRGSFLVTAQLIGLPGTLALAMAFVLISLNAMRAGLLTRFMGILGIIVGVLLVFPIGSPIPVVQIFWLIAVGLLLLGRLPNVPPAWSTGEAQPWPSTLERRLAQQGGGAASEGAPAAEAPSAGPPSPAPSRQKRKRRR